MDYTALYPFTVQCSRCDRAWSFSEDELHSVNLKCQDSECGYTFNVYEGLKTGLKNINDIFGNTFLANGMHNLMIDVKVGYTTYFKLPQSTMKVYDVMLIPAKDSFKAGVVDITNDGFLIYTSLEEGGDPTLFGKMTPLYVIVKSKIVDYDLPWLHLLQYSLDQFIQKNYLTCILLSETTFENFVDTMLRHRYINIGLDEDTVGRILISTNLPNKVNPLFYNMYGIKLSDSSSWKKWERKVLKWRNDIAHGVKTSATEDEAKVAYETIIDCMFYLIEGIDNYMRTNGEPQGLFYKTK